MSAPPTHRPNGPARTARIAAAGVVLVALLAGACGVPTGDDTFEPIADADVPLNLATPSTTTTSTTTTTLPTTSVPAPTTTTGTQPETAPVSLYFVLGDQLLPVVQDTISQYTPISLIDLLVAGPDPTTSPGLETLVDEDLVNEITVREGVATVDIDESEFRLVPRSDRALLFGQMVLTLTFNARTVGIVRFSFDGLLGEADLPNNLFKRNVTFDDYVDLIANAIVVTETSTTTTTTTTTTVPAEERETTSTTDATSTSTTTGTSTTTTSTSTPVGDGG